MFNYQVFDNGFIVFLKKNSLVPVSFHFYLLVVFVYDHELNIFEMLIVGSENVGYRINY